jgi:hypothetical protein
VKAVSPGQGPGLTTDAPLPSNNTDADSVAGGGGDNIRKLTP